MSCNLDQSAQLDHLHTLLQTNGDYDTPGMSRQTAMAKAAAFSQAVRQIVVQSDGANRIQFGGDSGESISYDIAALKTWADDARQFAASLGSGGISYVNSRCLRR
jgi:hypothetical protein